MIVNHFISSGKDADVTKYVQWEWDHDVPQKIKVQMKKLIDD